MNVFTMIVVIVAILVGYKIIITFLKGRERTVELDPELTGLVDRVADLEERVKTLERIQTDPATRLKDEIDSL